MGIRWSRGRRWSVMQMYLVRDHPDPVRFFSECHSFSEVRIPGPHRDWIRSIVFLVWTSLIIWLWAFICSSNTRVSEKPEGISTSDHFPVVLVHTCYHYDGLLHFSRLCNYKPATFILAENNRGKKSAVFIIFQTCSWIFLHISSARVLISCRQKSVVAKLIALDTTLHSDIWMFLELR
jgi:hypothetical protein